MTVPRITRFGSAFRIETPLVGRDGVALPVGIEEVATKGIDDVETYDIEGVAPEGIEDIAPELGKPCEMNRGAESLCACSIRA